MKENDAKLLDFIAEMAAELSPDTIAELASVVSKLKDGNEAGSLATWAKTPAAKSLLAPFCKHWSTAPDYAPRDVAMALLGASHAAMRYSEQQKIDLIWTGPKTAAMPVRRTDQALYELVDGASKTILIVSFVAYKVDQVVDVLTRAVGRGVDVRMILEMEENAGGKLTFDVIDTMKKAIKGARIFYWPPEKRPKDGHGHYGALHAKCAVADETVALISSANLTGHALELNMELGLLVRGGALPKRIHGHFGELMAKKVLIEA